MSLARVHTRALTGLSAKPVTVEVDLANGLPTFTLVGLADTEVKEARERVRAAIVNSGMAFPNNKRITVSLAPADLPKDSGRFDLPIALGVLAAAGFIDHAQLARYEFAGELSLSGELRAIRGALAVGLAMQSCTDPDQRMLVLPPTSAEEAAWVPGLTVIRAQHLSDVVAQLQPDTQRAQQGFAATDAGWCVVQAQTPAPPTNGPNMRDVFGQHGVKRALEIAAAGRHSVLMVGPPGAGKSMLAQRFAGLLPAMTADEALASAAVASLVGRFYPARYGMRPFAAPHHTASAVALVGGGSPPKPGEISLAHHGVLFLDEFPEFSRASLEALREPLETGLIRIARAAHQAEFPAQFQLIAAMNPCPCGFLGHPTKACRDTPDQVSRYQGKLSGPLLDRIDLHINVQAVPPEQLLNTKSGEQHDQGEDSHVIQQRVEAAHQLAMSRQGSANNLLIGERLNTHMQLAHDATAFVQQAATKLQWSARRMHRVMRVARTIADLEHSPQVASVHVAEAVQYQRVLGVGH